jgi:DNA primase
MKKLSPDLLQKIKEAVNLIEVVGEHVVLRKSGGSHVGLCPFHAERSPSFSVSESKQLYHCYGCGRGGDLVRFVMELHGLSFIDAVRELADRARISIPSEYLPSPALPGQVGTETGAGGQERERMAEKVDTAFKLNRFVARYFHQTLLSDQSTLEYLKSRRLSPELQRNYYLGSAPAHWSDLAQHLKKSGAPMELAVELGLIRKSTRQGSSPGMGDSGGASGARESFPFYDLFRSRVLFPILDMRGRVSAFGGRILPGAPLDAEGREQPKYLNSPESLIFSKSKQVFGLFQAQKHIRASDEVILVEGYFDVTALHSIGALNAVATCGTSLTGDHLQTLRRFSSKVTVLFDGDKAGVAATERAMIIGLENGLVLYGVNLAAGLSGDQAKGDFKAPKDPDEFVKTEKGAEELRAKLSQARPLIDQAIERELQSVRAEGGAEATSRCLKKVGAWLKAFQDPVGKSVRMRQISQGLGIAEDLVRQASGIADSSGGGAQVSIRNARSPMHSQAPSVLRSPQGRPPSFDPRRGARSPQKLGGVPQGAERTLLEALLVGGDEFQRVLQAVGDLPKEWTLVELFDSPSLRSWFQRLVEVPGALSELESLPVHAMEKIEDLQLQDWVRATLVALDSREANPQSEQESAGKSPDQSANRSIQRETAKLNYSSERAMPLFLISGATPQERRQQLENAVRSRVARAWARFSQQVAQALNQAEASKDSALQAKLMQDYLDVQRRMKEFTGFYDEIERSPPL